MYSNPGTRSNAKVLLDCSLVPEDRSSHATAKTDAYIHYVGAWMVSHRIVETDRSPTSSKIPLLLRFSLPVFVHRYAMHNYVRGSRSLMYGARSKEGSYRRLYCSLCVSYGCLSRSFFILQRQVDATAIILVKANRDGKEERMRRILSHVSLSTYMLLRDTLLERTLSFVQ